MKHILFSSYDELKNPYYAGGGARAIYEIAKRLSPKYAVTVLCGKYPGFKNYKKNNVCYKHVGLSIGHAKVDQLLFQLILPFYAMTEEYDIWFESFTPPFSTSYLPLFTRRHIVGLAHMLSGEDMKRKYKLPFDVFEKYGLQFYKNFIVVTEFDKNKIKKTHPNSSITIIPNGIIPPKKLSRKKGTYILYLGRIEVNQKGLDLLLHAFKKISTKTSIPLIIAGAGTQDEEKNLLNLITKLDLQQRVKILGRVQGRQKEELYQNAICVVIPSRFETFSLVALETLAHKKLLISFNIHGLSWIPKNARIIAKKLESTSLSRALLQAIEQKSDNHIIQKTGYIFSQQFHWDIIAKQYKDYIDTNIRK